MRTRSAPVVVLLVSAALVVTACGTAVPSIEARRVQPTEAPTTAATRPPRTVPPATEPPATEPVETLPPFTVPPSSPSVSTTSPPSGSVLGDLSTVIPDIEAFWTKEMPAVYRSSYEPVDPERIIAATPRTDLPVCDGQFVDYPEDNAFAAACREGFLVVWDATGLIPDLEQRFGPSGPAVVMAHEWGHIIQYETGEIRRLSEVAAEQQADCFAGAWFQHVATTQPDALEGGSGLDEALTAVLEFRDPIGTDPREQGAHGSGFDRIRAFQDGFGKGVAYCATYPDIDLPLVQIGAQPGDGGQYNLPLDEAVAELGKDVSAFLAATFTGTTPVTLQTGVRCSSNAVDRAALAISVCPADHDVILDPNQLASLYDRIGDTATGTVIAIGTVAVLQADAGTDPSSDTAFAQQACVVGGWLRSLFAGEAVPGIANRLSLSPGDMDEAIQVFLLSAGATDDAAPRTGGLLFSIVGSLQQGVISGVSSCGAL